MNSHREKIADVRAREARHRTDKKVHGRVPQNYKLIRQSGPFDQSFDLVFVLQVRGGFENSDSVRSFLAAW